MEKREITSFIILFTIIFSARLIDRGLPPDRIF